MNYEEDMDEYFDEEDQSISLVDNSIDIDYLKKIYKDTQKYVSEKNELDKKKAEINKKVEEYKQSLMREIKNEAEIVKKDGEYVFPYDEKYDKIEESSLFKNELESGHICFEKKPMLKGTPSSFEYLQKKLEEYCGEKLVAVFFFSNQTKVFEEYVDHESYDTYNVTKHYVYYAFVPQKIADVLKMDESKMSKQQYDKMLSQKNIFCFQEGYLEGKEKEIEKEFLEIDFDFPIENIINFSFKNTFLTEKFGKNDKKIDEIVWDTIKYINDCQKILDKKENMEIIKKQKEKLEKQKTSISNLEKEFEEK